MDSEEIKNTSAKPVAKRENCALWTMLKDFYGSPPSVVILAMFWSAIFIAGAIYTGVKFFRVEQVGQQIMYAAGFICFVFGIGLMKIFSWEIMNRNRIERDIRHLELRISQWTDAARK
jgi:hypothetical protein